MAERYVIYDLRKRQKVDTVPLRTKPLARRARRMLMQLTGETTRYIVIPGPEHRKWTNKLSA